MRGRVQRSRRGAAPLPSAPNALIGREAELAVVCRHLTESGVRLVTLTGPAGVGKTRLALAVAEALRDAFDDVRFIALAPVTDPALALPAIAQALGVRDGHKPRTERLAAFLGGQHVLLVLDNFEQLLGAAPALADLLAACPRLTLLTTSRAALRLRWEQQLPVLPLGLPDRQHAADVAVVGSAPAVALFMERARAVRPEFALTADSAEAVAAICRRLDGVPLAIELAAARIAVLSPQSLLERLKASSEAAGPAGDGALSLLGAGARDLPERQQTLRRAIGWSYDLLSAREQALFRRLGVFVGGCTLEAAEAVAADVDGDVLEGISALIGASLLQRTELADGEVRLGMLELIRAFALEQLERAGELKATRSGHARYYLQFAETGRMALDGSEQALWLARIAREYDNLRAAFAYATDAADAGTLALGLVIALDRYWEMRGEYKEDRAWVEAALAGEPSEDRRILARARAQLGALALREGDVPTARAQFEQSLLLYRELADAQGTARTLSSLGIVAFAEDDVAAARALFAECEALCRELGDPAGLPMALNNRGVLEKVAGHHELAARCFRDCVELSRAGGQMRWLSLALVNLGWVLLALAEDVEARAATTEGVLLCQANGLHLVLAHGIAVFGLAAYGKQQGERAARLFGASAALLAATGSARVEPISMEVDRRAADLRMALGAEAFEAAWAEGSTMTADEAVALALSPDGRDTGITAAPAASSGRPESAGRGVSNAPAGAPPCGPGARLTRRELEVLRLASGGRTSKEIAQELVLSERTVENHLFRIYTRIGARGRAEAIAYAIRHGLA